MLTTWTAYVVDEATGEEISGALVSTRPPDFWQLFLGFPLPMGAPIPTAADGTAELSNPPLIPIKAYVNGQPAGYGGAERTVIPQFQEVKFELKRVW